jgi:hypothetical protein
VLPLLLWLRPVPESALNTKFKSGTVVTMMHLEVFNFINLQRAGGHRTRVILSENENTYGSTNRALYEAVFRGSDKVV